MIYSGETSSNDLEKVVIISPRHYQLRFDVNPKESGAGFEYKFIEIHEPYSLCRVKEEIIKYYNGLCDHQIYCGFKWDGATVYLSTENQFNYKAAFDLAVQTGGQNLPIKIKLGESDAPHYVTFTSIEEFQNFFVSVMGHVSFTLESFWKLKDSINWSEYEIK